jgi:hypothetical protein
MSDEHISTYGDLKAGITESDVLEAISKSGYLFQAEIADQIRQQFSGIVGARFQEEWAYIDADSQGIRTLDVYAEIPLWEVDDEGNRHLRRVQPYLDILVECKQSELPYVLFLRTGTVSDVANFPEFGGMKSDDIRVFPEEWGTKPDHMRGESYMLSVHDAFACYNLEAFVGPPFNALSFAKVTRKKGEGGKLEISGEETYRGLTLPLLKAADYVKSQVEAEEDAAIVSPRFIVPVAVVRAPLMGAFLHSGKPILAGVPWARICRIEPAASGQVAVGKARFFDIVHSDFWEEYLQILMNDSFELAGRMLDHEEEVFSGNALHRDQEPAKGEKPDDHDEEPDQYHSLSRLPDDYQEFLERPVIFRFTRRPSPVTITFNPSEGASTDSQQTANASDQTL